MRDAIETVTDDATGITAQFFYDADPINPREDYDHSTVLTQLSDRYAQPDGNSDARILDAWQRTRDLETVSRYARAFLDAAACDTWSDPRSASVVFGYVTRATVAAEGIPDAAAYLAAELQEYAAFCEGDVYAYAIEDAAGDHLDSCGGFFGYEYALESMRDALAGIVAGIHAERAAALRAMASNGTAARAL